MSWIQNALGFGQPSQAAGAPTQPGGNIFAGAPGTPDPSNGGYPVPYTGPGPGSPSPSAGIAPPPSGSGLNPQQFQRMQYLINTMKMDPQDAYLMVMAQQNQPSGLGAAASGLGPVAAEVLRAKLQPEHLEPARPVPVQVQAPGPLQLGAQPEPTPATTTAAIIASLL